MPDGVFQIVNGSVDTVNALVDHPDVKAATFVGSSKVAEIVANRCALSRRCLALGGAKNHLVALPDCDAEMCARDIVASFAGCAGQRCMAASVLLLVGDTGASWTVSAPSRGVGSRPRERAGRLEEPVYVPGEPVLNASSLNSTR